MIAGMIAMARETSRRVPGRIRKSVKPSITTWPANVPVTLDVCPEASSAIPKRTLAALVPSAGASKR